MASGKRAQHSSLIGLTASRLMHNLAYRLALLAGIGGLVLLMVASPGDDVRTPLGVVVLAAAGLLAGLGKVVDLLGYVEEGATDAEEPP